MKTVRITVHHHRKRIWRTIFFCLFSLLLVSLCATKLIYDAAFRRYDAAPAAVPAELSALVQSRTAVDFPCRDETLRGYLYPGTRDTLVVLIPGLNAVSSDYLRQVDSLIRYGWGVFVFDPTGCGESGGASAVGYCQTVVDLDAALDCLEQNACFGYRNYALLGHSRGAYAACGVLREHRPAAVIAVAGANSAMEGVMSPAVGRIGVLAYANYPLLRLYQRSLFDAQTLDCDAAGELSRSRTPALIVQGTRDGTVPPEAFSIFSHRDRLPATSAVLLWGAAGQNGHTDLLFDPDGTANSRLMAQIHAFLLQNCGNETERETQK